MQALQQTVSDNPEQGARLQASEKTIRDWITKVTEPAIELRQQVNAGERPLQAIQTLVSRKAGKKYFDAFRAQIVEFGDIEQSLIADRQETASVAGKNVSTNLGVMSQNEEWVTHTFEVIEHANAILSAAVDMETGMRGYLLAGNEDFLAPYTNGAAQFYELVASLSETVKDNPAQVALLAETEKTIREWQAKVTEPTIALRREIGSAKTMDNMADLIGEARGKQYFDKFRALMADFQAAETGLMEERQASNESTVTNTFSIIGLCVAVALFVGLALAWLIGNGIANSIKLMTEVMAKLAKGDHTVDVVGTERSDEIGNMAGAVRVFKDNAIEKIRREGEQAEAEKRAEEEKLEDEEKAKEEEVAAQRREAEAAERAEEEKTSGSAQNGRRSRIQRQIGGPGHCRRLD
jgi:methyl-accepting chemotaxis protein